jgi:hypothetical protein
MALEVRYLKRTQPRVRSSVAKAKVARRKLLFFKGQVEDAEAVVDISSTGMKLIARGKPLAKGDKLEVEVSHPSLGDALPVTGVVRWVRPEPGEGRYSAGIEFTDLKKRSAEQLDRLVALELGSRVAIGAELKGYASAHGKEVLVYDLDRREVGTIRDELVYLLASKEHEGEILTKQGGTLAPLLRWVFALDKGEVEVTPPIDLGGKKR